LPTGAGLRPVGGTGTVFDAVNRAWRLSERDLLVDFVVAGVRG